VIAVAHDYSGNFAAKVLEGQYHPPFCYNPEQSAKNGCACGPRFAFPPALTGEPTKAPPPEADTQSAVVSTPAPKPVDKAVHSSVVARKYGASSAGVGWWFFRMQAHSAVTRAGYLNAMATMRRA